MMEEHLLFEHLAPALQQRSVREARTQTSFISSPNTDYFQILEILSRLTNRNRIWKMWRQSKLKEGKRKLSNRAGEEG